MARTRPHDIDLRDRDDREASDDPKRDQGRSAESPTQIPAKGWFAILKRTWKERKSDNVQILSAGVGFFTFLAIFPALIATVSVYGLVSDPEDVERQLSGVAESLPEGAGTLVIDQVSSVTSSSSTGLGISIIVSILAALWSASKGMQAMITALNVAYNEDESRGFIKLRGLALLFTLAMIVAVAVGVGGMLAVGAVASDLGSAAETAVNIARWPVLGALMMVGVAVLYRFAPDRQNAEWRWTSPGAVIAVLLWLAASVGFSFYVSNFGSFNETYGSLAAVIVLMLWLYLSAFVIIMGAEFDSEMERQTAKDSTVGDDQPLGQRDAHSADTVAHAR